MAAMQDQLKFFFKWLWVKDLKKKDDHLYHTYDKRLLRELHEPVLKHYWS